MNIDTEYLVNLECLLTKLWAAGAKEAVVAGGAIRDMLFDKPIKDIDVFYTGELSVNKLNQAGFKDIKFVGTYYEGSKTILDFTMQFEKFPVEVQLIHCFDDPVKIIEAFPANIGRCYYDDKGLHGINGDVLSSADSKTVWFDQPTNYKYYMKYKEKYSDWKLEFADPKYAPPELVNNPVKSLMDDLDF